MMRTSITAIICVLFLAACATVPVATPEDDLRAKNMTAPEGKALVFIFRSQDLFGGMDRLNVSIDGVKVGQTAPKTYFLAVVDPGNHFINTTIGTGIAATELTCRAGRSYYVSVSSGPELSIAVVNEHRGRQSLASSRLIDIYRHKPRIAKKAKTAEPAPAAAPAQAVPPPRLASELIASGRTNPDAIAVVIGNARYSEHHKDVPDVRYARNDATLMAEFLVRSMGYQEGNVLFLKDATQAQLISTFGTRANPRGKLANWIREGKSDVFVYYSGHGVPGLNDGRGYLLPVDADPATVELNGYPLEVLYENLSALPARNLFVVLDACFSGSSPGGAVVRNASSVALRLKAPDALPAKGVFFTASSGTEVASWDNEANLGLFTRHFLEGANGGADLDGYGNRDGRVTVAELKRYLDSEVTYQARKRFGREQHPQVLGGREIVLSTLP